MKRFFGLALALALVSAPAFAGTNSQSVNIPSTVKVGSAQIPAGDYKVSYTGTGTAAQITIAKNGKVLATAPATVVAENHPYNSVTTQTEGGANVIQAIQLSDVKLVLAQPAVVASK
jgi:hypothetical protein